MNDVRADIAVQPWRQTARAAVAGMVLALLPWTFATAQTGFLDIEGGKLFYETTGTGPAMVFLHDGHMHSESWDAPWSFFSKDHRLIRYDRRGYGQSTPASAPYSNVDDLFALLTYLRATNVVLVGCSAGGKLAIDFTLEHPALVRRLVLVGPVVSGMDFSEHFDQRVREAFRPLQERRDVGGAITNWMNDPWLIAPTNNAAKERFREIMTANPHNMTRTGQYSRSPSRPAIGRLGEIRVPTLILVGALDMPDVHAHCGAIQAGILNSQRLVVPGASHFVHLEISDEFDRLVTRFLAGSGRARDLVYYLPSMENAVVRSNLVYKTVGSEPLEADLYMPWNVQRGTQLPVMIFILGDAAPDTLRHAKDWTFIQSYGRLAAASGCAGITFNHRSSESFTKLPEVRSDIDDLIRYVRANAARLDVNADRMCLWFFSGAGVHFESGLGTNAPYVRCIVGYYPVLAPSDRGVLETDLRRRFSAIDQIKRHAPGIAPLLIAKAGRDSISLNQGIEAFRKQAVESGVALEFLEHPAGEHAFDIRNDDETSCKIIQNTLKFVERHLSP